MLGVFRSLVRPAEFQKCEDANKHERYYDNVSDIAMKCISCTRKMVEALITIAFARRFYSKLAQPNH